MDKRLIVGMSGASGAPLAVKLLQILHERHRDVETHLIVTRSAELTLKQECNKTLDELSGYASVHHKLDEIGGSVASGSFITMGMIIVPCSMKTVAGIVSGYSENLLLRAADVCIKERRKLVIVARESPLSTLHLRNLCEISQLGAVVIPPMLTYYNHPVTIEDCTEYMANRILDQFCLSENNYEWKGIHGGT